MAPYLVAGGVSCAVGSNAATTVTAIAAGLSRLWTLADPTRFSNPVVIARALRHLPVSTHPERRVLGLLLDAVDAAMNDTRLEDVDDVNVLVGWPDPERPGAPRPPTPMFLADVLGTRMRRPLEPERIHCLTGETSGARALVLAAQQLSHDEGLDACLVVAADSWLTREALRWLEMSGPVRRRPNGMGMAPAEAGAALWLVRRSAAGSGPRLLGCGVARVEAATSGSFPLGMAIEKALCAAVLPLSSIDHAVVDVGSDAWGHAEVEVVMARLAQRPWHGTTWSLAESIGHVGAPAGLIAALVGAHVVERYGDGGTALCVVSGYRCRRVAMVVGAQRRATESGSEDIEWAL